MRLLSHELFHPRLDQLRTEANIGDLVGDTGTLHGGARSFVRNAMDELRCDLAADAVLKSSLNGDLGQGDRPLPFGMVGLAANASYLAAAADAFDELLPSWQAILEDGDTREDLKAFETIARDTGRLVILLAHAEAEARSLNAPGVFGFMPDFGQHPVGSLIEPTWTSLCAAFDRSLQEPDLPPAETALITDGASALTGFWRRLGFTPVMA